MSATPEDIIDALQVAVGRVGTSPDPFEIHLEGEHVRTLLGHLSELHTRIAQQTARATTAEAERDRARHLVVALTSGPEDHHEEET